MTRDVLLMRHAEAVTASADTGDHERPLTEWGRQDARRIAEVLKQEGLVPERILVSSAVRTRQTVERMVEHFGAVNVEEESRLYLASPSTFKELLEAHSAQADPLLIVAHNPTVQNIVSRMAGVLVPFPTASLAHVILRRGQPPEVVAVWRTSEMTMS